MVNVFYFIKRKLDLNESHFYDYWLKVHAPIAQKIPYLTRYVQNHLITSSFSSSPYHGSAEISVEMKSLNWMKPFAGKLWPRFFDSIGMDLTLQAVSECPEYKHGAKVDEPNFIDLGNSEILLAQKQVVAKPPQFADQVKYIVLFKRKPGMEIEDFRNYWLDSHSSTMLQLPEMKGYEQCPTVPKAYYYAQPRWDGFEQIWFDNVWDLESALSSENWKKKIWPDKEKFIDADSLSSMVVKEYKLV